MPKAREAVQRPWGTGAASRNNGMTYSTLMNGLKKAGVMIDRKMLAEMAVSDAAGFTLLIEQAKAVQPKPTPKPAKG